MIRFFDDSLAAVNTSKQGYYSVGTKFFNRKMNALIEASKTKQPVSWEFHTDVFQKQLLKPRLDVSLLELYKQRALQLREKYDYLILAYSGGADSDNMLRTFIDNNIKLDEVWCDQPLMLFDKAGYQLSRSTDATNMPAEWFFVIKPELEKLAITNPEIKIHISDSFSRLNEDDEDDTTSVMSVPSSYPAIQRYRYIINYVQTFNTKGISTAVIVGVDKCIPTIIQNHYGFLLSDTPTYLKTHVTSLYSVCFEYFFWTPDMPSIVVEQAYRLWDKFLKTPESTEHIIKVFQQQGSKSKAWMHRRSYLNDSIATVCYPHWDLKKLQVDKTAQCIYNMQYVKYLNKFSNERFIQGFSYNTWEAVKNLNPHLCFQNKTNIIDDTKRFLKFFKIGEIE